MNEQLLHAKDIIDEHPDEALRICNDILNESFDDMDGQMALFMSAYIMMQAEKFGLAYHMYERCAQMRPDMSEIWSNMGMCLEEHQPKKAKTVFEKAIRLDNKNERAYANKGLMCLQMGDPAQCVKLCNKALEINPKLSAAVHNRSLARLMLRDWDGWDDYYETLGVKHREMRDYGKPEWNGEEGTVLVYGEQGVGDEILFASCLEDLAKTNKIVLDTDARLKGLFERSFDFSVFGDRFKTESKAADQDFDYQCALGQLPYFYRRTEESFPGTPFLTPDPERCIQWRALFDTFKGRKIGIAWRGGLPNTGMKKRSMELSDLAPLLNNFDTFISLEYKPVDQEDIDQYGIKSYPRATAKGGDIDDLAALVYELDFVITVPTAVTHVAGSLGVPCYVLVPSEPSYRYHLTGSLPWYNSVDLIRQERGESWRSVSTKAKGKINDNGPHRQYNFNSRRLSERKTSSA